MDKDTLPPDRRTPLTNQWPGDTVMVFIGSGPGAETWTGNFSGRSRNVSFELAREALVDGRSRTVLRNIHSWAVVREWRVGADSAWLVFTPNDEPDPSADDVVILAHALAALDSVTVWDRADDRNCANDRPNHISLFCLLARSVEVRMGRFHFRQPALQVARVLSFADGASV